MKERAQNADFRRKPQIFGENHPFSWKLNHLEGAGNHRKPQIFARKPKIFAENRRKPQIGLHHLGSVTFSSALFDAYHLSCLFAWLHRNRAMSAIAIAIANFLGLGSQFPLREYRNPPAPENPGKLLKSYNLADPRPLKMAEKLLKSVILL